jgi:hypothetical protein
MTEDALRRALCAIAAHAIDADRVRTIEVAGGDRTALLSAIGRERLTGLAVDAATHGCLEISRSELDELLSRHEEQLALDLRLERLLCEAVEVLDGAGIPYRALKGPVLAHTTYRDPALRSFGDIDLLVRGEHFDESIAVLGRLGFRRRFVEPRRGFDARFSKGSCLERPDGLEIDLHRTLAPGAFGMMLGRADLFAPLPQIFRLGSRDITGLARPLAFVHACFHATLGDHPPRLVPLRDVAVLLEAGFDANAAIDIVAGVHCETVVRRALERVEQVLGWRATGPLAQWARTQVSSRFDRWAMRSYERQERSYAAQAAVSLWAIPSLRDRVAYATALAVPSPEYVRARQRGYRTRAKQSFRLARTWRPR